MEMEDTFDGDYEFATRFDFFRDELWIRKTGEPIKIKDMTDQHLLAAFKLMGDEWLRDELLIRLFESKLKNDNEFRQIK